MQAVVVTFDHLALAFLGCYGNTSIQTPQFDRLAADSVVFDQCFSALDPSAPVPGIAALADRLRNVGGAAVICNCSPAADVRSSLPSEIGDFQRAVASDRNALLWLRCSAIASPWNAGPDQIDASWRFMFAADALFSTLQTALATGSVPLLDRTASLKSWIETALPKLRAGGWLDRERFADSPAIGRLRRCVYAAAVGRLDAWLGELLAVLDAERAPDSLLVVTAGDGDFSGPHPELASGCPPLIDPLVHVPLFIRTGTTADGTRRGSLVSTADIAPTLADWLQLDHTEATLHSRSLWPLLHDEVPAVGEELLIGAPEIGWRLQTPGFACVSGPAALQADAGELTAVSPGRPRLFVKPDDVWEMLDVAREYPAVTEDMLQRIRTIVQPPSEA